MCSITVSNRGELARSVNGIKCFINIIILHSVLLKSNYTVYVIKPIGAFN